MLEAARVENPIRGSGAVRNCEPAGVVMLNPEFGDHGCVKKMDNTDQELESSLESIYHRVRRPLD
jgi:hypothetical protein